MLIYRTNHSVRLLPAVARQKVIRAAKPRRAYTQEELVLIDALHRSGLSWREVGIRLGRDKTSVRDAWIVRFTNRPRRAARG